MNTSSLQLILVAAATARALTCGGAKAQHLGGECLHCMEQMREANERAATFQSLATDIVAISKDDADTIAGYEKPGFNITLLTDREFANAKRFRSFDDFEEIELHSTILIDKQGRIHWSEQVGDPFMDFEFLESEVKRLNRGDSLKNLPTQTPVK